MQRLFIAAPLPEAVAARLAALGGGVPGARWVPEHNLHITLRFIGEVDGRLAGDIAETLAEVDGQGLEAAIEGVDIFGSRRDARVLYAGVTPKDPLKRLRDKIEAALQRDGLPAEERKFHPHVTLARLRGAPPDRIGRFLQENGLLMSPPFGIEDFILYESIRGHDGAVYHELRRYPLRLSQAAAPAAR
jgi:2'-5' RNA ligase